MSQPLKVIGRLVRNSRRFSVANSIFIALLFSALTNLGTPALCASQPEIHSPSIPRITAFVGVNIIPMDSERVMFDQTVIVKAGKIREVGPVTSVKIPAGALRIDGRGKFLMPGLCDMHTHIDRVEDLPLFIAAGVTTTLNMGLASDEFVTKTRLKVETGKILGPHTFAAFMIDGPGDPGPEFVPNTEAEARDAVDRAKARGYEFIKVYSRLKPDMYTAVMDQARKDAMPVVGHIPLAVGLEKSLGSGQLMIAHAEEYYKTYFNNKPDESLIPSAVELTRKSGAFVTPNLSGFEAIANRLRDPNLTDAYLERKNARYLRPDLRASWLASRPAKASDRFMAEYEFLKKLTLALSKAGVPLISGTDAPIPGMFPGFSLHDDLRNLVAAGLTPYLAISAATRVPGSFIRQTVPNAEEFGTIEVGKRADLVLLAANPLADVANAIHPLGVMVKGRWFTADQLQTKLEEFVPEYQRIKEIEDRFSRDVGTEGAVRAIAEYRRKHIPLRLKLNEAFFNSLGYRLLGDKKSTDAVAIFKFNTEQYPASWNAYDSLGEAYAAAGNEAMAIESYRRSVALNPRNLGGVQALRKLEADKK